MVVSIGIILIFIITWMKNKNNYKEVFEKLPKKQNELKVLYPMAYGILQLLAGRNINLFNKSRKRDIESLNVVTDWKESEVIYTVRKISLALLIIVVSAVFGVLYELSQYGTSVLSDNSLKRPMYWQQTTQHNILANDNELTVTINPQEYSFEQVQQNFVKAYEYILGYMKKENESLDKVSADLNLLTYVEEYAINVSWISSHPEIIDTSGAVNNYAFIGGEEHEVVLTATLSYLDYECKYEINVKVVEPVLSEEEDFLRKLTLEIRKIEEGSRGEESVKLPQKVNDTIIEYDSPKDDYAGALVLLGIVTAIAIFPGMDKDLEKKIKDRKKEMVLDYSEIVSKLNILSGSGMSILHAWEKIVKDYEKKLLSGSSSKRFAYEEMKITYYEIQSGRSESNAYSNFGKRCNIHEYLKLGALLEQNVRKGAKGLSRMLEEEANQAFEQRKNLAKKLGEEAGTKMLLPMIVMLAIVMVIVLVPALTSFGI